MKSLFVFIVSALGIASPVIADSVTLAWDEPGGPSVAGYRVWYGQQSGTYDHVQEVGLASKTTVAGLAAGKQYFFSVTAYDDTATESLPSNEVAALPDLRPLTVSLTGLRDGAAINGPRTVPVGATAASPDSSVLRVEFFDGKQKLAEDSSAPYQASWQSMTPGVHKVRATAWDAAGRSVTSDPVTVDVVPVRTSAVQRRADGAFEITVEAAPGSINKLYASSDLQKWTLVDVFINTDGVTVIVDPAAAQADRRFYRVEGQ